MNEPEIRALEATIDEACNAAELTLDHAEAVDEAIRLLDAGAVRVCEPIDGGGTRMHG